MSLATHDRPLCAAFFAQSLDGFIARDDGAVDWLDAANQLLPPGEDCGWHAFIAGIDTLVIGRASYEQVLRMPHWPYTGTPVVVASRRPVDVPRSLRLSVQVSDEAPRALVQRLVLRGRRRLYVDGGRLVGAFLREGLLDEITVTTVPVLIGRGRRLFGAGHGDDGQGTVVPGSTDIALEHRRTQAWPFGFVQSTWRVLPHRPASPPFASSQPQVQET